MKDNLHSYMKVGIVQLMAYPETDTVESIRKIARTHFSVPLRLPQFRRRAGAR